MNASVLKILKAVAGLVVVAVIFFTVRGWWTEYQAAQDRAPKTPPVSTQTADSKSGQGLEAVPAEGTLIVLTDGLNLRDKPAIDGVQIRSLDQKEKLTLVKKQGDWYFVKTSKDEEGWISANKSYTKLQKKK
jgi:uncharacterized protein YgiM (DUF1202 family)